MKVTVWHCYWYGPHETIVVVAGSEEELRTKVRESISALWDEDEQGPMPEDWDTLVEAYEEHWDYACYFGDWGYTEIEVQP